MPRFFVSDSPVAITEDVGDTGAAPNVIYIRAKMTMEIDARVKNELIKVGADNTTIEARMGENQLALLLHNITGWEGPDLGTVPCDAEHIRQLDPTEPLIQAVLSAIAERNQRPVAPKKRPAIGNTLESAGEADLSPQAAPVGRGRHAAPARPESENGILASSLLGNSDGRQHK